MQRLLAALPEDVVKFRNVFRTAIGDGVYPGSLNELPSLRLQSASICN